jgi:hypothetical protein
MDSRKWAEILPLFFFDECRKSGERMKFREFVDPEGRRWQVWFVHPTSTERRKKNRRADNVTAAAAYFSRDRRIEPDRRVNASGPPSHVLTGYENGWLCFESEDGEKRRLLSAPEGWENLPPERLWLLCRIATPTGKPKHPTRRRS